MELRKPICKPSLLIGRKAVAVNLLGEIIKEGVVTKVFDFKEYENEPARTCVQIGSKDFNTFYIEFIKEVEND